jgi:hypothetical protein
MIGGALSFVRGNPIPILRNILSNADLKPGEAPTYFLADQLETHEVYIKDVEYIDTEGKRKRCQSLEEYFELPLKKLRINKHTIARKSLYFEPGECGIFG